MKKLLYLLLFIPLVFACGGSEEKNSNSLNLNSVYMAFTEGRVYYESGAIQSIRPKKVDGKLQGEWIHYYE